jgi:hypothetical protein
MAKLPRHTPSRDTSPLPAPRPLARDAGPRERWRFRRNLVIYLAHRQGLSQSFIADAFALSRSLVRTIITNMASYEETILVRPLHDDRSPLSFTLIKLPRHWSAQKRSRWRRDQVIRLAHRLGLSQRYLADVFDLPRSRIGDIIRDEPDPEKTPGSDPRAIDDEGRRKNPSDLHGPAQ